MHINPHWIYLAKRLVASWFSIGFWLCILVFNIGILILLYRHRIAYAEGLLPDLIQSSDGLIFSAAKDTEHAMTVFFALVVYFGISLALTPFIILYCYRLRRDLHSTQGELLR